MLISRFGMDFKISRFQDGFISFCLQDIAFQEF